MGDLKGSFKGIFIRLLLGVVGTKRPLNGNPYYCGGS